MFNTIPPERSASLFAESDLCDSLIPTKGRFAIADSIVSDCLKSVYYIQFLLYGGRGQPVPIYKWIAKDRQTQLVTVTSNTMELEKYVRHDYIGAANFDSAAARKCALQIATILSPNPPVMFLTEQGQLKTLWGTLWARRFYEDAVKDYSLLPLLGSVALYDKDLTSLCQHFDELSVSSGPASQKADSLAAMAYTSKCVDGRYELSVGSWSPSNGLIIHWCIVLTREGIRTINWEQITDSVGNLDYGEWSL